MKAKAKAGVTKTKTPARKNSSAQNAGFEKLGIHHAFDFVLHLPLRYDDETQLSKIAGVLDGTTAQVEGVVVETDVKYRPRRQLVCTIKDASSVLTLRFLNFYPSQIKQLSAGVRVRVYGEVRQGFFGAEMVHPRYRVVKPDTPLPTSLTPVYPTTAGLSQAKLRAAIDRALTTEALDDTLPVALLQSLHLPAFSESVKRLHHPPPAIKTPALQEAWRRIKFDELLAQQLSMRVHRARRNEIAAPVLKPALQLPQALIKALPFRLTPAQQQAWQEIQSDLAKPHPMQRLLQGDVGSGKTVVAALAALQAVEAGVQVAVMAPTEILAEQHYRKLSSWLTPLHIKVDWIAGALPKRQKREALERIANGATQIAIGTHALFQDDVAFQNLGLAIVDEQHRFGVRQRLALRGKGTQEKIQPHQLMMSATPIPRTLAMSYYADLDVSVIQELPPGRTPIVTKLVDDARRDEVLQRVRDACVAGQQAYWVCPLIEESEKLELQTALETYERLQTEFPELNVGLIHGRLKSEEKAGVMQAFQRGEIQLLVATTVIEVGVDVPNATLMVIEHAERMGLAQLHQLRGRVGRGAAKSACILLFQSPLSDMARERLKIIYENTDGFEIARHDLQLRGPGELLGARQSGEPLLRFADLNADVDLLEAARDVAEQLLRTQPQIAEKHLERWLGGRQQYLKV